ncbi:MAG: SAM-dependent chlorinase/fluorinase [Elusimicrobia bacterium]|nr:SAM-dependent chlorinase/fluorinase [Candidatus Obscuribacterium magneticum]
MVVREIGVMSMALVCLLTDFGSSDGYVGVMKGVILSIAPEARFVDLTHGIAPQDVRSAAFQLLAAYRYFPKGTLFLSVVDPGVGSNRRILYTEAGGWHFLAPDNGLLSWVLEEEKPELVLAVSKALTSGESLSRTFHGRDVFAPLAGRFLKGEKPTSWGSKVDDWARLPFPSVKKTGRRWTGEILAVDHFGNLITNIRNKDLSPVAEKGRIEIRLGKKAGVIKGLASTYNSVPTGRLLAIAGSAGFVEISQRDGNAAKKTGLNVGDPFTLMPVIPAKAGIPFL